MAFTGASSRDQQPQPSEFELRRAEIVGQIGDSLDQVLSQINALNRSLESIIEIGNEFASVEALWSQFESVAGVNDQNVGVNRDARLDDHEDHGEGEMETAKDEDEDAEGEGRNR